MHNRAKTVLRLFAATLPLVLLAGCTKEAKLKRSLSRADDYFKAGEYEKAKIEYLNVLKANPGNGIAIRQLGLIWSEQGAPLRAIPYLYKTRELEPGNLSVRLKLAQAMALLGQIADARKEAQALLEQNPGQDEAIILLMDTSRTPEEFEETEKVIQTNARSGSALPHLSAANAAARKRDLDAVQAALDQALAADPKSSHAHIAQGNLYLTRSKLDEAAAEYKVAAELSPVRSIAHLRFAEFVAQRGKAEEAVSWIDGATKAAPDYIPAWIVRARIAVSEKKLDESLADLQKVFAIDGQNLEGRLLQGQIFLAKNEIQKAVDTLVALDKTFSKVPTVKYHLARAYVMAAKPAEAAAALRQAVSANPDYIDAILLLADLDLRQGEAQPVKEAMLGLLKKQPELAQAQLLLAEAYRSTGLLVESAAIYEQRLRASPNDTKSQLLFGLVLRQQGKINEARQAFSKVEEQIPDSLLPLSQLVDLDLIEKNVPAAMARVEARIAKEPTLAGAWYLKGRIFALQADYDQAEAALQKVIELDTGYVEAYNMLAYVYVNAGKLPAAIERINQILAKKPDDTSSLMLSGLIYGQMKDFEKARTSYEKLLALKPEFAPALNNLAWLYSENLNQPEKALELARRGRNAQPDNPAVADTFGWILYRQGQYDQASTVLREASSKLTDNPEVTYHLGMAAYMMGDKELARRSLEAAANSPQPFPGKDEIKARLALLPGAEQTTVSPDELKQILEKYPQDTVAWMRLGEVYEQQNAAGDAVKAYENALKINPKLVPALLRLASLNAESLNNNARALELARSARELAPSDPAVAALAGHVALKSGNQPWAYSLLQEAARGSADNPSVQYDLAMASYSMGRLKEACETMQRVTAAPNEQLAANARRFLTMVTPDGKHATVAPEEVDAALKANPADVPALMQRASAEERTGDAKAAVATYNEILKVYPAFAPAQKRLAVLYVATPENKDKAYSLAVEARKTLQNDLELTRTLAAISYQRGEFPYALQLLESSAKREPLDANGNFYLGMTRYKTKASPTATQGALQASLAAGLGEPMASEAKRVLAELDGSR